MDAKKIIFFIIVAGLAGFWAWYFFFRIDRNRAIKIILKYDNDSDMESLKQFGEDYLIARAKAYQASKDTFELNGKKFNTTTGKAV